ncbi:hypothetical protein [Shewanella canadensis]|nr:hypothetical protein [Shewanella canadensis]
MNIKGIVVMLGLAIFCTSAVGAPGGKGKDKNWAITLFDEASITCVEAPVDAEVPATGTIIVGHTFPQCYKYSLAIPDAANPGDKALEQLTSTFNLDKDAENEVNDCSIDDSEVCDGVINHDPDECSVFVSRPDSAVKLNSGNIPAHQDELIVVSADTGDACTVTIFAITDGAQEGAVLVEVGDGVFEVDHYELFLPTKCTPLREHTRYDSDGDGSADIVDDVLLTGKLDGIITNIEGLPFVEYVGLNTGTRAFRGTDTTMYRDTGNRNGSGAFAIFRSLQLKPDGCDTDGDTVEDIEDNFPLDPTLN